MTSPNSRHPRCPFLRRTVQSSQSIPCQWQKVRRPWWGYAGAVFGLRPAAPSLAEERDTCGEGRGGSTVMGRLITKFLHHAEKNNT